MIELNQFEPDINRAQVWKAIKVVPTIDGNMNICLCSRLHAHRSEQKQFILKHHEIHTSYRPTTTTEAYQCSRTHTTTQPNSAMWTDLKYALLVYVWMPSSIHWPIAGPRNKLSAAYVSKHRTSTSHRGRPH